jgi:hypothetical protein
VCAVIGEDGVHAIWHGVDEGTEKVGGGVAADALMQFDEGELGCPADADAQMELALLGTEFGDVDMKVADRIGLEPLLRGLGAVLLG